MKTPTGAPRKRTARKTRGGKGKPQATSLSRDIDFAESLIHHLPGVSYILDDEGRFIRWNRQFEDTTGFSREEIAWMKSIDFFSPEDRKAVWDKFGQIFSKGKVSVAVPLLTKSGEKIPFSFTGIRRQIGKDTRIVAVGIDISEQKRCEQDLKDSEERYKILFECASDGFYLFNLDGEFIDGNRAVEELLGFRREELIGKHYLNIGLVPEEEVPRMAAILLKSVEGQPTGPDQFTLIRKDGIRMRIEIRTHPVKIEGKLAVLAFGRDVQELRRMEDLVNQKSRELERSNRELQQFAYIASHDLKEPLRMVASYLKLLERRYRGTIDRDADEFIYFAVDGASRMQQMIDGLLSYSRIQTQGNPSRPTDCQAVLEQTLDNLKESIAASSAVITYDPLPTVMADQAQLVLLFQNLITNAIKFRGADPPHIHVSSRRDHQASIISIRDNGIGFDPQYADNIFQIFQRLHSIGEYPGTGIGLAICKRIVERHGGSIWFASEPGKGATFFFSLPDSV